MTSPPASRPSRERIYEALKTASATRPALAQRTGLSLPTVIAAVDELIHAGLATLEHAPASGGRGRPAARVRLTPERLTVTALDLGGAQVATGRYDLARRRLTHAEHGPPIAQFTRDAGRNTQLLLGWLRSQGPADLSVVSALGAVNPRTRTITSYPLAMHDHPLEAQLGAALGWPVIVENDANLSAWHAWHALRATPDQPLVFLNYGHGIGVGLMLGGAVYHGASGAAGEVSYAADPARRSRHEPLAVRLLRHLHGAVPGASTAQVAALAAQGDPAARRAMRAFNADLANHLTAVAAVLDPALIVLQDLPHAAEPLRRQLQRALDRLGLGARVLTSPLGPLGGLDSAAAYGAGRLERARLNAGA